MSISINDGQATPVAHVFEQTAAMNRDEPAEFMNRANTNGPSFWERFRQRVTLAKKPKQPHVTKLELYVPFPGTDTAGNPVVIGGHTWHLTGLIDQTVAQESRINDSLTMVGNLATNSIVKAVIKKLAPLNA